MKDQCDDLLQDRIKNLSENTDFTATLFESLVGYAIIAADFDGNVIAYNEGARQIYGYDPEEISGKQNIEIFFPPDFIEAGFFQQAIDVLLATGRFAYEGEKVRKDGARFPAQILFTLTKDKTGKVVGFVEIVEDLTERKQAEEEMRIGRDQLARANAELRLENSERKRAEEELHKAKIAAEAANRAKSEFLANMSHEIRTPMNGILGMTAVALDTDLTPEQRRYLELVRASAGSLLTVINDILDFSKIEAGKLDLEVIDFLLRDRLDDTMKALALRAHEKGLELACHIASDVIDALAGDPGRLGQVVINLVGNAIKFTERGEVVLHVETDSTTEDWATLHFTITDTGIGIPREKLGRIFEAFTQADSTTTRQYGGTGLGLSISVKLVELMGGRIWVESEVGRGSAFHFTARLGIQKGESKPVAKESINLRDLPVLVVDDNATNRLVLREMLTQWRLKPTVVESAPEALAEMKKAAASGEPFVLVISDVMMPVMDGFMLAEEIKRCPELAASTLLMLSSSNQQKDIAHCREAGIGAYLMKPVKQSELLDVIVTALNKPTLKEKRIDLIGRDRRMEQSQPSPSSPPLQILLTEDNATNQTLAIILLEKQGHAVVIANNGKEALAALDQREFDLVLMDIQMPEMDGLEATGRIREKEKITGQHVPIIAMTAHAMKGDRERCLEAGMDGYVSKPIQAGELYQAIASLVPRATVVERVGVEEKMAEAILMPATATEVENDVPQGGRTKGSIDKAVLLACYGGKEVHLRSLASIFMAESASLMTEMRNAIANGDASKLKRSAHSLKGAIGIFGIAAATEAAQELESIGQAGNLAEADKAYTTLEKEIDQLKPALAELLIPSYSISESSH